MSGLAIALHALAAVVWVGGMFFAYNIQRPAAGSLDAPVRLALWGRTFARFFQWVWAAIAVLLATGYWLIFMQFGGFRGIGLHVHLMQGLGIVMILIYLHLWFAPYARFRAALAAQQYPEAGKQLNQIRRIVGTNLILGLVVVAIGASGRYWS
ncbi:MAG: hypothetical protein FJX67_09555 [Alphaproteobacteria bacterium]|nr:hypothetical protein [Alphaproteobacteria bacterium]